MRPYRFPPLDLLQAESQPVAATEAGQPHAVADAQALAHAFEQASQRGHEQGFAQGLQAGQQEGLLQGQRQGAQEAQQQVLLNARAELQRLGQPVNAVLDQLNQLHADWQASLRKDVIELVERVARQVVRCELTLQPAQILSLVEETLQGMPQRNGDVRVFLNPSDLQRIEELDAVRVGAWKLTADSSLEAGECRLRVGEEEVDAGCKQRLGACMDQVRDQLLTSEP